MAFLHFLVFMKCNEKLKRIKEELRDAHGTEDYAVQKWQQYTIIYHECLKSYMEHHDINKLGGSKRCAVDETVVGKVSTNGKIERCFVEKVTSFNQWEYCHISMHWLNMLLETG